MRRGFKEKFGATLERYIEGLLTRTSTPFINEEMIDAIYAKNKVKDTKITNFIIANGKAEECYHRYVKLLDLLNFRPSL